MVDERMEISRRKALKRVAVAGAVAWTAPMIVSSTAHAAGSLADDACLEGRPNSLTYGYFGSPWTWDVCNNPATGPMDDLRGANFIGNGLPCLHVTVATSGSGVIFDEDVNVGESFALSPLTQNPNVVWVISACGGTDPFNNMIVHVSCSQSLCVGDVHGFFQVTGFA
jgi:hypothetical protein